MRYVIAIATVAAIGIGYWVHLVNVSIAEEEVKQAALTRKYEQDRAAYQCPKVWPKGNTDAEILAIGRAEIYKCPGAPRY